MRGTMLRRVVIGIALAIVGLSSVLDIRSFTAIVALIGCGSLFELQAIARRAGAPIYMWIATCAIVAYFLCAMYGTLGRYEGIIVGATLLGGFIASLAVERHGFLLRTATTVLAVLYLGKLLSYFITIRAIGDTGIAFTVFVIFVVAFTDIFAMLIGRQFGKTRLISVSPGKTVEGAAGALAVAVLTGIAFAVAYPPFHLTLVQGGLLAAETSIAAQIGDAVESGLKRDADLKDAGSVLPGHGGLLDRFDSYLFGGVVFYAMLALFGRA